MAVKIEFSTANAAFADWGFIEVQAILEGIAGRMNRDCEGGVIRDSNGNRIGQWVATIDAGSEGESE